MKTPPPSIYTHCSKNRALDLILLIAFILITSSVLSIKASFGVTENAPSSTWGAAERSYLEARTYEKLPQLDLETILSGSYQTKFEKWISDSTPNRDGILLFNAALQRIGIQSANLITGYECYPTFYGSTGAYITSDGLLTPIPEKINHESAEINHSIIQSLNTLIDAAKKNFYIYVPYQIDLAIDNPVHTLTSNCVDSNWIDTEFLSAIPKAKIIASSLKYEEYIDSWLTADGHWNMPGALNAVGKIGEAMGIQDEIPMAQREIVYEEPLFHGSINRKSLFDAKTSIIKDYEFYLPEVNVFVDGRKSDLEDLVHLTKYKNQAWNPEIFTDRYAEYFHENRSEIIIENASLPDNHKSLLIIGDSYSNCIERLFSNSFKRIYIYDCRLNPSTLHQYINQHQDIEDILILMNSRTLFSSKMAEALS